MTDQRPGPRLWFGCDPNGSAWKAYCEAWEHCFRHKSPQLRGMIADRRGKDALAELDHNIAVVKADYAGEVEDRAELPKLLRL